LRGCRNREQRILVAAELDVTPTQLRTWRLELEAAGSASAIERQRAGAAELAQLRRDNRRLKEEVEVLRKASAFFAQWAAKT
jgi:transposase-like protein